MEGAKEENVEYHIEIQKCGEGVENNDGEVMYVLDFGGADIPENLAMSIAQWAADRSLSLEDGNSSIVLQNETGVELAATQVVQNEAVNQVEDGGTNNEVVESDEPQVIHVKMEDGLDYVMDAATAAGISSDSIVYNVQDNGGVVHIEKPGMGGRIEQRNISMPHADNNSTMVNLGDIGNIQIQNPDGSQTTLVTRKPFVVKNNRVERKSGKPQVAGQGLGKTHHSHSTTAAAAGNKGTDRLPITPFLKGKTPVMLMVGEDGQVSTDVCSLPPLKIKADTVENAVVIEEGKGNDIPRPKEAGEPMILDFPTEKSKLDKSLKVIARAEKSLLPVAPVTERDVTLDSNVKDEIMDVVEQLDESEKENMTVMESVPDNKDDVTAGVSSPLVEDNEGPSDHNQQNEETDSKEAVKELSMQSEGTEEMEKVVKCCTYDDCEFKTADVDLLAEHMENVHEDLKPFCCFVCDKRFKLNLSLKIHQLIHMKDAKPRKKKRGPYGARDKFYNCPVCSFQNKYKRDAKLHLKEEHGVDKPYTCESCKFICLTQMELNEHNEKIIHRTDNKNYCEICNQLFTNIYQHKAAVHSDERPHCCTECGYKAKTKSSLRYHMVTHLKTKDWSCPQCPYKTTTERRLKRHMKVHDPNKKYECNLCSFATHDAYEYKRHHIKVHSKTKTYSCKFCNQKFLKHHEIRLHLIFEHDCNDSFFCGQCDFTCSTRSEYKEHIQTHYGRHRHVCEICGFTGRYKTHYRRHMLTHSDQRLHECKICGKKVSEASNLRRHMLTHSEDKPLACSVCGYRCKIRSRLMNHMKTHAELRPFACHLCKYTTKFNGNLVKHLENHAKYKPHKCEYCSYSCNEKNKLKRHIAFRHKGLADPKQEVTDYNNEESEMNGGVGVELVVNGKEMINKEQILLLPNKELVIMQGDNEEKIVLPVNENGLVMASADQEELMAQLQSGSVVLTVEEAPPDSVPDNRGEQQQHLSIHQGSVLDSSEDTVKSIVMLGTEG